MNQIELLAPAGDESGRAPRGLRRDAVYLAGKSFGMRAGAKTLTWTDSTALCVSRMNAA